MKTLMQRMMVWRTLAELRADLETAKADVRHARVRTQHWINRYADQRAAHEMARKLAAAAVGVEEGAVAERRPAEEMTPEELRAAFDVGADNALWQAVLQVIDQRVLTKVEDVARAPASGYGGEARAFDGGGLDELRELTRYLLEQRRKARTPKRKTEEAARARE